MIEEKLNFTMWAHFRGSCREEDTSVIIMSASKRACEDDGICPDSPPRKRISKHVADKYQADWKKYYMQPSQKGNTFAFRTICKCDFSVVGGGAHEVKRHCDTAKHRRGLNTVSKQPLIGAALSASDSKRQDSLERITAAELYFTSFLVEHNLSLASAVHF